MITEGKWTNGGIVRGEFPILADGRHFAIIKFTNLEDTANDSDNARLIAAAPELLAAIKAMFNECAMIHKYGGESYNGKQSDAAIKAGREAIAAAEPN